MNGKNEVWDAVENFRAKYAKDLQRVPVGVLECIEIGLRIDVIPFPDLFSKYSVDAAVTPDFRGIYVDRNSYEAIEGKPPWMFNRLRFSLAHELGHIVMHKEIVKGVEFKSLEDFWNFARKYTRNKYTLEWEANEFAGRLIVPIERLKQDFDKFTKGVQAQFPSWWSNAGLRNELTISLAATYQVSKDVISCRLDREELWPSS
jgi:Zn-dependent peptidase ImmA (M78 family)